MMTVSYKMKYPLLLAMFAWTFYIVQTSSVTSAFYRPSPGILQENWSHSLGYYIEQWHLLDIGYPDCPHSAANIEKFEWSDPGYSYTFLYKRFRSYFISPETGSHQFFIACYMQCQFSIGVEPGTTESLIHRQTYAPIGWMHRAWTNALELQRGFRYKIEVLYIGVGNSPFLKVGVQFPNGTQMKPLDGRVLRRSMEFYRTSRLFVEQYNSIQFPPVHTFESFIQIPANAAKYPEYPSAVVCRQSIYDSDGLNSGYQYALRYSGYFVPDEIGNYTFHIRCDNFCQMNVTKADRRTVAVTAAFDASREVDVGEMKNGNYYKVDIFLAENFGDDWLKVKYMKRQLDGDGTWKTDWTGLLKNLSPSEAGYSFFHAPTLTVINSTAINVLVGPQSLPSVENWTYANAYDIVFQDSSRSNPKSILPVADDLPSNRLVANLRKHSGYTFHVHYYGYIDGSIEYNIISRKMSLKTDEDVPDVYPPSIVVRATSSTSVQLQWSPLLPSSPTNGLITGYEVKYVEKNAVPKIWISYNITGAGNRLPTISGLSKYTMYEFKVAAKTSKGSGVFSPVIEMKTLQDKPSAPPSNIVAENTSSTSIRISWGDVPADHQNGIITGYIVYLKQYLKSSAISSSILPAKSIEIKGLKYWTIYQVNVSAQTSIGEGSMSNGTLVRTDEDKPGGPPQGLATTALSSTSVKVEWLEIDPALQFGIILSYKIKYQRTDKKNALKETISLSTTAVLSDLNEYTDYDISVAGSTSKGAGIFSTIITQKTLEDLPAGVPGSVRGNFLSATEIFLEWDNIPIEDQNGVIIAYNITYRKKHSVDVWRSTMNSTSMTVSIGGLAYYTIYEFKVAGKTAVGQGPSSSPVDIRTDAYGPTAASVNISGITINESCIKISWSRVPEEHRHGIILGYKLSIKDESILNAQWINHTIPFTENAKLNQTFTNLKIYTPYSVKILAYNYRGEGPFSQNVTIRTGDFAPSGIPKNVSKESTTSTGISLSWLPMKERHGEANGKVNGYIIRYQVVDCHIDRPAGCDENDIFTIFSPNSTSHITIQKLRKYTNYSISVQVVTNKGNGTLSAPIYIKTDEDKPDDTPNLVESWPSKINTIKLYWSPIPESLRNGIIIAYRIFYKPINMPVRDLKRAPRSLNPLAVYGALPGEKMKIVDATTFETELDELKDYSWYQIRIGAVTSKGMGVTFTVNGTCKQEAPVAAPTFNIIDNYDFYEISLNWDNISRTAARGEVLGHRIYYWPIEQNDVALTKEIVSTVDVFEPTRSLKIKNLQPYTTYRVNISAFTEGGFGVSSKHKIAETCRCPKMLTSSWTRLAPLVIRGRNISGIMPKYIEKAVASCCGNCTFGQGPSSVDWTHDASNTSSFKHSREMLKKAIFAGTHITMPFFKDTIESEGSQSTAFDYVPMILSPGMAIFKKKQSKREIGNEGAKNLVESMLGLYPVLIVMVLFTVIAGIIFWILDRGVDNEQIPSNFINGCGSGIWLAFITMTTAGYGDIYPKTKAGRIFAIIWTFVGIVITSLVVGQIVTALNAKVAVVPSAGNNNIEPNSKMMASNETLMIAITKLRQRTVSGNTSDPETIKQSLLSGKVSKVMLEAYEAGQRKEALKHPDIEFDKLEKVDSSYGVVLAGESRRIKSCLKRYLKENSPIILQELGAHSVSFKRSESDSVQEMVTILSPDADLTMQIIKYGGALLLVLVIFGALFELRRSCRGRAKVTIQKCKTVELFEEIDQMLQDLVTNISCKTDEIQLKQSKEIIKLCRMDVKDLRAIAPELIIFNEDLRRKEEEKPYQSSKYVYNETAEESDVDMPIDYKFS